MSSASTSQALIWLCTGATLGLALAIGSLASPAPRSPARGLPGRAVAAVDGKAIALADYRTAVQIVAAQPGVQPNAARRAAVQQLIDEELLIAYGLQLDLVRGDSSTRKALLSAVFSAERAPGEALVPSEAELRAFHVKVRAELERPGKLHVRQFVVRVADLRDEQAARARAEQAVQRLRAGEAFATVNASLGSAQDEPLPDGPLAVAELRRRIGPLSVERALALAQGETSDVLGSASVLRVLQLVHEEPPETPSFEEARHELLAMYRRRAADERFAAKLQALRQAASIQVAERLP